MLGVRDPQAPYNVEKILDTINNLVRVLELTLMLNLSPAPPPPTPPATVILPKATTLGSGLDQVSPQSACDIHSKVLTDRIATITKWATSVSRSPTISSLSNPLGGSPPPTPSCLPLTAAPLPPLAQAHRQALQHTLTSQPHKAPQWPVIPSALPTIPSALPKATPPKARPHKATSITPKPTTLTPASPSACPASYSAGPANLGITHPIPPISPAALSAAPACLGITYPEPITRSTPSVSNLLDKYFPKPSSTITPIPSAIDTIPPPPSHNLSEERLLDLSTRNTLITEEELKDPRVTRNIILQNITNNSLHINPKKLNRGALIKAYLEAASASLQQPLGSKWIDVCKKCKDSVLLYTCYDHSYDRPPPSPTPSLLL
jgi:hypothetical protein